MDGAKGAERLGLILASVTVTDGARQVPERKAYIEISTTDRTHAKLTGCERVTARGGDMINIKDTEFVIPSCVSRFE